MKNLTIRNVDDTTRARFRAGAAARDIDQAQFLARLLALHDFARAEASLGSDAFVDLGRTLEELGLQSVIA